MFIKASAFKKLAKDSWERGVLVLSRKADTLLIQGASWIIAAQIDVVPNKIRAILVEMCGFLPDEGQTFRAAKGYENQYEFEQTIRWDWIDRAREDGRIQLRITRAAWQTRSGRVMRIVKGTDTIFLPQESLDAISPDAMVEWEDAVQGPYEFVDRGAFWLNSYGTAIFMKGLTKDDEAAAEYLDGMKGMEVID